VFTSRRQPGLVALLHSGIQCSSCGIRFPEEERKEYREHLDQHFRENRRHKESGHNQTRGLYLSVAEWKQYENIEDQEETGMICNSYPYMTWRTS
jgi:pre-mRNA cleavage complex 2 protein Pcf11